MHGATGACLVHGDANTEGAMRSKGEEMQLGSGPGRHATQTWRLGKARGLAQQARMR